MWKDIIKSEEVIDLIKEARRLVAIEVNTNQMQAYKDIYAEYIKTKKNFIAKEVLTKHSFKKISKNQKGKNLSNLKLHDKLYYSKIKNIDNFKASVYD